MTPDEEAQRLELIRQAVNASPYYGHMGMEVRETGEGLSRLELTFKNEHCNIYGFAHGGVLASLIDSSCGLALTSALTPEESAVTVDLRINYFLPFSEGTLTGRGRLISRRQHIAVAEAEIRDEQDQLVAKGITTHFIMAKSLF